MGGGGGDDDLEVREAPNEEVEGLVGAIRAIQEEFFKIQV